MKIKKYIVYKMSVQDGDSIRNLHILWTQSYIKLVC